MKRNKGCKGENKTGKSPPPVYSNHQQKKLEILPLIAAFNVGEVSGKYTHAFRCK